MPAPANDNFADATEVVIATNGGTYTSSAVPVLEATGESGEPSPSAGTIGSPPRSIWWKYTPTSSGTATFDTMLTVQTLASKDTIMSVYTGSAVNALTELASNDDTSGGGGTSRIADLSVTGGTTYWIQAGAWNPPREMSIVMRVVGPATTTSTTITGSAVVETDTVQTGTVATGAAIAGTTVTETDAVQTGAVQVNALVTGTTISETDSVQTGSVAEGTVVPGGLVTETDAVQTGTVTTGALVSGGLVTEVDTVQTGSVISAQEIPGSTVTEIDTVQPGSTAEITWYEVDLSTVRSLDDTTVYNPTGNDAVEPVEDTFWFTFPFSFDPDTTYAVQVDYEPFEGSTFSTDFNLWSMSAATQAAWETSDIWTIADTPAVTGSGTWSFDIGPGILDWDLAVAAGEPYVAFDAGYKRITGIRFSPAPLEDPPEVTPDETIEPQLYDAFANALLVDYDYGGEEITLRYGTVEVSEPVPAGTVATSWITWHAEEDEVVNFSFTGDDGVEFTVTAFAGSWANPVGSVTGTNDTSLEVPIVNGTQYWLQFASATTELDIEVSWELGPTTVEPSEAVEYLRVEVYEEDGLTLISELPRRLTPSGQEPLNEPGPGEVTVHLDDEILKAYPNILDFGNIVKCFLAHKCIHGFRIRARKTTYISSGEWAGYVRTVSGPSVMNLMDDFIVRHDLPGDLQDRTLAVRPFTWAAPPGTWFDETKWGDPYNSNTQTDPPSDFSLAPKDRSKWGNPPEFPDPAAKWMWIHPEPEKNEGNFDPPPLRGVRYYRKTFTTDAKKLVRLYASADEEYTVYLNGEEVISGSGEETGYTQLEKRKLILPEGQHTIGIIQHFNAQVMADGADAVIFTMMEVNAKNKPTTVIVHSDETWLCTHERPVPSWHRANVLRKTVNEARDRGNQSANRLTFGFTADRDTHNRRWTDRWDEEVPIGTTALELQKMLSEGGGFDVWVDPGTMEIRAWRRRGRDKSKSVTLEPGKNLLDWEVEEIEEVRNTYLIQYDRGWTTWRAKGSSRRFGRREAFVEMGRARGDDHARQIMRKASRGVGWASKRAGVSDMRKRQADQPSGSLISIHGARPFLDFGVGDIVKAPNEDGVLRRHRVVMLSFTEDENGNLTFDPELEEL